MGELQAKLKGQLTVPRLSLRPDLTKNSAKRVLKSKTPRKQFCLRCTFPRFDTAGAKTFYQRKT